MKPSAARVLQRLRRGPATTHDLMQPNIGGVRFSARICELRNSGFVIEENRLPLPTRGSRYTLVRDPQKPKPKPVPAPAGVAQLCLPVEEAA